MAVYLQCERCGRGSYGEQHCDACKQQLAANHAEPESPVVAPNAAATPRPVEPPKSLWRQRQDKIKRRYLFASLIVATALLVGLIFGLWWFIGWVWDLADVPDAGEKIECSDQLMQELIEEMGFGEAAKWASDHCE